MAGVYRQVIGIANFLTVSSYGFMGSITASESTAFGSTPVSMVFGGAVGVVLGTHYIRSVAAYPVAACIGVLGVSTYTSLTRSWD